MASTARSLNNRLWGVGFSLYNLRVMQAKASVPIFYYQYAPQKGA